MQISEGVIRLGRNILLDLHNSSDHTKPYPVIANYVNNKQKSKIHGAPLTCRNCKQNCRNYRPLLQPDKNTNIIATQGRGRWVGRKYVTRLTQFSLFNRQILF